MKKLLFALFFILAFSISTVFASPDANVTFAWDANSEPDLAGYRLYQFDYSTVVLDTNNDGVVSYAELRAAPGFLVSSMIANIPVGTETVTRQIADGTWYWVLVAYDTNSNVSAASNEVTETIEPPPDTIPPAAPTGLTKTVVIIININ